MLASLVKLVGWWRRSPGQTACYALGIAPIAVEPGRCWWWLQPRVARLGIGTAWGARVMEEVNSSHVKLLFDIYHMQIMEGDLIHTIRNNINWIGHFHTGGVPGRHELNDAQEVNWVGIAKAIADLNFAGTFAHEFIPVAAPLAALEQAVRLCAV